MPRMLTVDEQFEAIIAGADVEAKMSPSREPDPERSTSEEEQPARTTPSEENDGNNT
ncbi:hypothetical protein AB0I72_25280 [Nocardiopsis sp. NPDC049922]|uniref:hypothetical protein n=1 Tax=Nocardiopsis sp. NPDC049922 TaxID=3155157 RepID=UPI0033E4349B